MVEERRVPTEFAERLGILAEWPRLEALFRRWQIVEVALFGSALRDDFREDSDLDLLVRFAPGATWSLIDHIRMEDELSHLLGRRVDLVTRYAVESSRNPFRKQEILETARTLYAA